MLYSRRANLVGLTIVTAVALVFASCSKAETDSASIGTVAEATTSIVLNTPDDPNQGRSTTDESDALATLVLEVDDASVDLAEGFRSRYLSVAYESFGLTKGEATCVTTGYSKAEGFEEQTLGALTSNLGGDPDTVRDCLDPDRLGTLGELGTSANFDDLDPDDVQQLLSELLLAQMVAVGMSEARASCAAFDAVVEATLDGGLNYQAQLLFAGAKIEHEILSASIAKCLAG